MKPHPSEYEEVGFSLIEVMKIYLTFILIFVPLVGLHQESTNPGGLINKWIRMNVYKQGASEEYFKENHTPFDTETPLCDYKTLTPKEFFNKFVRTHTPCLFKGYAET